MCPICASCGAYRSRTSGVQNDGGYALAARVVYSVVVAGCQDDHLYFADEVDEAVLVIDPA
jgi:hypothetical protein